MANSLVWMSIALTCLIVPTLGEERRWHEHFGVEQTDTISTETLMKELSNRIEIPQRKTIFEGMFVSRNSKIGQRVATLLSNTDDKKKPIFEQLSAEVLLELNYFDEYDCSNNYELRETCEKFCSKKEAKLDVPPTDSNYMHLNLGKYCWQIVEGKDSKCRQWDCVD